MKIAIIGNRTIDEKLAYNIISDFFKEYSLVDDIKIVSGGAKGVDTAAERYAKDNNIPTLIIKPDYSKYPFKIAPLKRNDIIIDESDIVFAIWNEEQKGGTYYTINHSKKANKKVIIFSTKQDKILTNSIL